MSEEQQTTDSSTPAPEMLTVRSDDAVATTGTDGAPGVVKNVTTSTPTKRRLTYKPSHRATFIGLAVVGAILAVNAVIIAVVMRNQAEAEDTTIKNGVTISSATLDKLGMSRNPVGNAETELIVGPNSKFGGKVTVGSDLTVGGKLTLNGTFRAPEASFTKMQAGDTQLQSLNVNGDGTISTLNLRKDLQVAGTTRLQGSLTVNQLTTINNNLNVAGNLSIGGTLSVRNFQVGNLTVAGHLVTTGAQPGCAAGNGLGSNGTASISGNDTAGTISVATGVGANGGVIATVTFAGKFDGQPRVNVTPVGRSIPGLYVNRTSTGFVVAYDGSTPPGGFAIDYIVAQ